MLTINEDDKSSVEISEIIWRALEYFPRDLWIGVNYLGNMNMEHDVKLRSKETVYRAFIFHNLIEKIRRIRKLLKIKEVLLAVTCDPIIAIYHRFEVEKLSCFANLIHDYVSGDVGVVSLFQIEEEKASKVVAHGLGHNRGLRHHVEPVDIMYEGLLKHTALRKNGFCNECLKRMIREK